MSDILSKVNATVEDLTNEDRWMKTVAELSAILTYLERYSTLADIALACEKLGIAPTIIDVIEAGNDNFLVKTSGE